MSRIVETDNFDGDYPNESFVLFQMPEQYAKEIVDKINHVANLHGTHPRYWKVVEDDYKLLPGFEP